VRVGVAHAFGLRLNEPVPTVSDATDDDNMLPPATAASITENAGQAAADPASAERRLKG